MKIVVATHNKDKFKELYHGLKSLKIKLLSLDDFPEIGEIIEDGKTLEENALIKARTVNQLTSLPAISDDTGLFVDALNGDPGIYSARYAGENSTYLDNVNKMLHEMKNIPEGKRQAKFSTVMAYVDGKRELIAEGFVKGIISNKIKGIGGFGYDSIFYIRNKGKTFSEMSIEEKNLISHRSRAIDALKAKLASNLSNLNIEENA
ncbi:MAG: non-canonical purine NTP pyrophosphatase, RdgB/HAM1 family [Candidatus Marinimicrobia bacterium]|nr:non-canonical purine NTP pyrophosphatase, RdgB/HAM1 family [Candidatus Neomarinimicrobiota bacterium]